MSKPKDKRSVDMQIMRDWVEPGSRVLDLGCGRGVLLEYLKQTRQTESVGVDMDPDKIRACVKRGLSAYLGDMMEFMAAFPDKHFDRIVCSRTLQELDDPLSVIKEALRVSNRLTIGFVNYGYWRNRLSMFFKGHRIVNEVYPQNWWESHPTNPLSVLQFERFCATHSIRIAQCSNLGGNWASPVAFARNWRCGYAIYDLEK